MYYAFKRTIYKNAGQFSPQFTKPARLDNTENACYNIKTPLKRACCTLYRITVYNTLFAQKGKTLIHKFSESLLHRKTATQHQNRPAPVNALVRATTTYCNRQTQGLRRPNYPNSHTNTRPGRLIRPARPPRERTQERELRTDERTHRAGQLIVIASKNKYRTHL